MEHAAHDSPTGSYNVNLQLAGSPRAGDLVELSLVVTEQRVGEPLTHFELLHERLMHLIIVHEPLADFAHVHPVLEGVEFRITHAFANEGSYKLWAEVKPIGAAPVLTAFRVQVAQGTGAIRRQGTPGYRVTLNPSSPLPLHQPVELDFEVADSSGQPVTDLEPLMGAGGHCVTISADLLDFLHVHPIEEVTGSWQGGPRVRFQTTFHRSGRYRSWGQFQHRGQLITAGFDLQVG